MAAEAGRKIIRRQRQMCVRTPCHPADQVQPDDMPARAPDLLLVVATQWRARALGHAGDPDAATPTLDTLAGSPGTVRYAQAVTPHPFGPFARAALLTGRPSPENGVRDYWDALPADARTIAHDLKERGYATAFFGKWGVGARDRSAPLVGEAAARVVVPPDARGGFAHWVGFEGGFLLNDPWLHGDGIAGFSRLPGYQSDVLASLAGDWLEQPSLTPRFALLSLEAPHPPYAAPTPPGTRQIQPTDVTLPAEVPRGGAIEARARRELAGYHAHLSATDAALARLFARLPSQTVIIFTSVHGDMHGSHGLFRKGWPHEDSVRVPLLVRGAPGADPTTSRSDDAPVSLLDIRAMMRAFSAGQPWRCAQDRAAISMPCVVALPDQCDRTWRGWRSATEKHVFLADGTPWILPE